MSSPSDINNALASTFTITNDLVSKYIGVKMTYEDNKDNESDKSNNEDNLQIDIVEVSPVSISNTSPRSNDSTKNHYTNRKCGICRQVGHTRTKCPKAAFSF